MERDKKTVRSHVADSLKGIAILMVIITHYAWTLNQRLLPIFPYFINMAVPIFMIISGYLGELSFERRKVDILKAYSLEEICRKIIRYTIPYIMTICWILVDPNVPSGPFNEGLLGFVRWVLNGTRGQGSYYYPILLQLIFLFPLIHFVIRKWKLHGLWLCLLFNAIYEFLRWLYGMNEECYRLLVFRYTFLIATGVYASISEIKIWQGIVLTLVGGIFIGLTSYGVYTPQILNFWTETCFISVCWIVPLVVFLLRNLHFRCPPLEIIGKASYNIFFVQMLYYLGYRELVKNEITDWRLELFAGIVVCIVVGILFYKIEQPLTRLIDKRVRDAIVSWKSQH